MTILPLCLKMTKIIKYSKGLTVCEVIIVSKMFWDIIIGTAIIFVVFSIYRTLISK